ncbi:hypothetical protein F7725_012775 [Dissostichus mawsoni]|uniref:Uncharacterized protein n=1 Tax=Dissostichus mawsoni TaxID=36200 RepID=A0A7J5YPD6_DISMA|nr:hypothetical protein F7725_012775 [Dissostichus mawsoni]
MALGRLSQALLKSSLTQSRRQLSATADQGHDASKLWKRLTYLVALPGVARFPWGDGSKSLFHNRELNALPGGYEGDE